MLTTTFGYHPSQDRIWMTLGQPDERLWLTRRLAAYLLGAMSRQLEQSTPGAQAGADAPTRARIEHEMAFNEPPSPVSAPTAPAQQALRLGQETREVTDQATYFLCERIRTTVTPQGQCELAFAIEDGSERNIRLSRSGLHRWLRALLMVVRQAQWLEALEPPQWLQQSLLPPSLQEMIRPQPGVTGDNGGVEGDAPGH